MAACLIMSYLYEHLFHLDLMRQVYIMSVYKQFWLRLRSRALEKINKL